MSAPGGRRPGAGRPKGAVNKNTADVKALAIQHAPEVIATLAKIALDPLHSGCVTAGKELLDRAYGKSKQAIVGGDEGDAPIAIEFRRTVVDPKA